MKLAPSHTSQNAASGAQPRPLLRPGATVRLDRRGNLNFGAEPALQVPDSPEARLLLTLVDGARSLDRLRDLAEQEQPGYGPMVVALAEQWLARGIVLDAGAWPGGVPREELAAAALTGRDPRTLAPRRHLDVQVHAAAACTDVAELLGLALRSAGIVAAPGPHPDVVVMLTAGDPPWATAAAAADAGLTHLVVVFDEGRAHVGPWIEPGRSPCLRCADRARAHDDPRTAAPRLLPHRPGDLHGVGIELQLDVVRSVVAAVLASADRRPVTLAGRRRTWGPEPGVATDLTVPFAARCCCHLLSDLS